MKLMRYRPAGKAAEDPRLGRYVPDDFEHFDKYPLSSEQAEAMPPTPVVIGINWYSNFDNPVKDSSGKYWIGKDSRNLGSITGGHCVCLKPRGVTDYTSWWDYYNQYRTSRCVQFGCTRAKTLMNRKMYEIRPDRQMGTWLYEEAQRIDEWEGGEYPGSTDVYGGTSVRAGLDVMRIGGLVNKGSIQPSYAEGIKANRWITSFDDLDAVLGYADVDYYDIINSWGRSYPHLVRIPKPSAYRVWSEDGEFGVITNR